MAIKDVVQKYKSKNKATSNMKFQQFLSSLGSNDVDMYQQDSVFKRYWSSQFAPFEGNALGLLYKRKLF